MVGFTNIKAVTDAVEVSTRSARHVYSVCSLLVDGRVLCFISRDYQVYRWHACNGVCFISTPALSHLACLLSRDARTTKLGIAFVCRLSARSCTVG